MKRSPGVEDSNVAFSARRTFKTADLAAQPWFEEVQAFDFRRVLFVIVRSV